ncbi:hypothetical protein BDK51DRAFT_42647 [Blyttiomyces helicus]|uniref:Uncharacterized protein n=1 Tax=Blyttiomyces helicus TaxID=388810 RepID=A0A4P9WSX4_9FUNG|nr:hypothetical protein BDK51DRAFT_42647 [Blyttiomyces helicus]|eukprot:RKO94136.1 hypothetical protein BDK51DRAFT_42647 [Blyttiomyces helicus]
MSSAPRPFADHPNCPHPLAPDSLLPVLFTMPILSERQQLIPDLDLLPHLGEDSHPLPALYQEFIANCYLQRDYTVHVAQAPGHMDLLLKELDVCDFEAEVETTRLQALVIFQLIVAMKRLGFCDNAAGVGAVVCMWRVSALMDSYAYLCYALTFSTASVASLLATASALRASQEILGSASICFSKIVITSFVRELVSLMGIFGLQMVQFRKWDALPNH